MPRASRPQGMKVRVDPEVLVPRADRAKLIWPVTFTGVLVHEVLVVSSQPVPLIESNRAVMPLLEELGRSKDGPPNSVVMQPGLTVVPPAGKASKDWMVLLSVADEEWIGV